MSLHERVEGFLRLKGKERDERIPPLVSQSTAAVEQNRRLVAELAALEAQLKKPRRPNGRLHGS